MKIAVKQTNVINGTVNISGSKNITLPIICGALLTMFFMTPHLIEKLGLKKTAQKQQTEVLVKQDTQKVMESAREYLRPAKKLVQFRSEQA